MSYSTFIGGTGYENVGNIAVDSSGNAYITGETKSDGFPTTTGAYDTTRNSADAYITKFNSTGSSLLYSTFLGGSHSEDGRSVVVDDSGDIYATGATSSADFPTTSGAYDTSHNGIIGDSDVYVIKLSPDGSGTSDLLYSTYIGGSNGGPWSANDRGEDIVLFNGDIFVTGYTVSTDFPTTSGTYDTSHNGYFDVFVAQISPDGSGSSDLVYSTYLGGSDWDSAGGIAIDSSGDVYVAGWFREDTVEMINYFPTTTGAYDESYNGGVPDVFVSKFSLDGNGSGDLIYSTVIGSSASGDYGADIEVVNGEAFVTGRTSSSDYPTTTLAYDDSHGGIDDVIVSVLSDDGSDLLYSTFIGDSGSDTGYGIAVDSDNNVYVMGVTSSTSFPTTSGVYDESYNGSSDFFVFKLTPYFDDGDIDPATFDQWSDVTATTSFYLLDSGGDGYFVTKKHIEAQNHLIDTHCKTNAGTLIPHYHFETDLSGDDLTDADYYWDWYFDVDGSISTRDSSATNVRDSLAYATDGQKSANYDYWVIHSETSDKIFTDDWTARVDITVSTAAGDRLAYEDSSTSIYEHATIVNSRERDYIPATCTYTSYRPKEIQWKQGYSGVYKHTHSSGQITGHDFSTHGYDSVTQNDGSAPTGTWDYYLWSGLDADVYY